MERMKKKLNKELVAEDWCFVCKDGGSLRICDYGYQIALIVEMLACNILSSTFQIGIVSAFAIIPQNFIAFAAYQPSADTASMSKVDFYDQNTVEFLFYEYWENHEHDEVKEGTSEPETDDEFQLDKIDDDTDGCKQIGTRKIMKGQLSVMKRKAKSKKKKFIRWGSEPLLEFLASIGKDTSTEMSQCAVMDIIIEYCRKNKLFDPEIWKKINLDARLQILLGRKSVNRNSIYNLLTPHLAENLELSEDEFEFESEIVDEDDLVPWKRQQQSSSNAKSNKKAELIFCSTPSSYATAGVQKTSTMNSEIMLQVSNMEEREDLCQRVKNGLLKGQMLSLSSGQSEEQSLLLCEVPEVIADDVDPEPVLENAMIKDEQEPNDGSSESALGRTTETPCCDLKCNGTSCCQNGANNAAGIEAKDACNVYGTKELELVIKYPQDCKCRKQYMRNQKKELQSVVKDLNKFNSVVKDSIFVVKDVEKI
ncbi:hypothetical protein EZV62_012494 [Acer yangbiense]|uniref:DM2 domain-containing protein n=1 Tax=Acer yangbiense TaxID=1000413 RepID=A0A5C7HVI2_9ROSI|nr:hypothetical protein EZV62_012494 [Acer yangbiense]